MSETEQSNIPINSFNLKNLGNGSLSVNQNYGFSKVPYTYDGVNEPTIESNDDFVVRFVNTNKTDDGTVTGYNVAFTVKDDKVIKKFGSDLRNKTVKDASKHCKEWFGKKDMSDKILKSRCKRGLVTQKDDYDPLFSMTLPVYEVDSAFTQNVPRLHKDGTPKTDKNGNPLFKKYVPIKNPDPIELLKPGTVTKVIFTLKQLTIKEKTCTPSAHIGAINIVSKGGIKVVEMPIDEFDQSKVEINAISVTEFDEPQFDKKTKKPLIDAEGKPITKKKKGGRKGYVNYDSGRPLLKLKGVKFAYTKDGIEIKQKKDENKKNDDSDFNNGKKRFGVSVSLQNGLDKFFADKLDNAVVKALMNPSDSCRKEILAYLGEDDLDEDIIRDKYTSQAYYSKKVRAKMENGEKPEHPPILSVELPVYDGNPGYKVFDGRDGSEYTDDLGKFVSSHKNAVYDIDILCKHIWFGDSISVKWTCSELRLDPTSASSSRKFNDDDDDDDEQVSDSDNEGEGEDQKQNSGDDGSDDDGQGSDDDQATGDSDDDGGQATGDSDDDDQAANDSGSDDDGSGSDDGSDDDGSASDGSESDNEPLPPPKKEKKTSKRNTRKK